MLHVVVETRTSHEQQNQSLDWPAVGGYFLPKIPSCRQHGFAIVFSKVFLWSPFQELFWRVAFNSNYAITNYTFALWFCCIATSLFSSCSGSISLGGRLIYLCILKKTVVREFNSVKLSGMRHSKRYYWTSGESFVLSLRLIKDRTKNDALIKLVRSFTWPLKLGRWGRGRGPGGQRI